MKQVIIETSLGSITVALNEEKAPITVKNFLDYAASGHYDGTIFHRVIEGFMIQGGGFDRNMNQKPTKEPIKNEAMNGLKNKRGTIAMARTMVIDSATSQFFINLVDNDFPISRSRLLRDSATRSSARLSTVSKSSIRSRKSRPGIAVTTRTSLKFLS